MLRGVQGGGALVGLLAWVVTHHVKLVVRLSAP